MGDFLFVTPHALETISRLGPARDRVEECDEAIAVYTT
jgi:hypothetical protein